MILYGISNCDTVSKARRWLNEAGCDYQFHDFRKDDISSEQINHWCDKLGWEKVLNKRSTSWRKLSSDQTENIDQAQAVALMAETPTLIKRPVLVAENWIELGFKAETYHHRLG